MTVRHELAALPGRRVAGGYPAQQPPEKRSAPSAPADTALPRPRPRPQLVDRVTGSERNTVYVICDRTGAVRHVGSTAGRLAWARMAEPLDDVDRTREWHEAWVIPRLRLVRPLWWNRFARLGRISRLLMVSIMDQWIMVEFRFSPT